MRIAVTYDNGNVFQHFGKTKEFMIYTVDAGKIASSEILNAGDTGHEALAGLLAGQDVEVVICGGLGAGADAALKAAGIEVFSGVQGSTDEAVNAYLDGTLTSEGINCDHHDHADSASDENDSVCDCGNGCGSEDEGCGCDEEGCGCGDDCGCGDSGCGGGCGCGGCGGHELRVILEGKNAGKNCSVHYHGTFNDGTVFDSSYERGKPIDFICGTGMMISGFDKAVVDMEVGDIVNIHLSPEEAYGMPDPRAIFTVDLDQLEGSGELKAGDRVYLSNAMGQPVPVTVKARDEKTITFDANHEMAGKELNFKIELVSVM